MKLAAWQIEAIEHGRREYPREACGLVVNIGGVDSYRSCANRAEGNDHFIIAPQDYADAEAVGDIVAVFHSHPNASAAPSEADRTSCEASGLPWHIVGIPSLAWGYCAPCGYRAPLIGRPFYHGVLDCYALIRDYFAWELAIPLPDFDRSDNWWKKGGNLYVENFSAAGFSRAQELKKYDVILMQVLSDVPNHGAVYLGDDKLIHHLHGRLSCRDIYGGYWRDHTTHILRHSNFSGESCVM